jgi:hypothetical protein
MAGKRDLVRIVSACVRILSTVRGCPGYPGLASREGSAMTDGEQARRRAEELAQRAVLQPSTPESVKLAEERLAQARERVRGAAFMAGSDYGGAREF